MLKNSLKIVKFSKNIPNGIRAGFRTSASIKEKWDLLTAVLIERKPILCPELNDLQKEFKEYLSAVEFERGLKNETEIKLEKEKAALKQKKDLDIDVATIQSTQDLIDAYKEEFRQFKPADRLTDADKSNDVTSLQRKLDKRLVFVLKQELGDKSFYILPQGKRAEGETLRQCADRVLKEKCGQDIKARIFGNAPCGFYKYKYPKSLRSEASVGAKVFIYFARYSSGQVTGEGVDFKWLDKPELDKVLPDQYKKSVLPVLFD